MPGPPPDVLVVHPETPITTGLELAGETCFSEFCG